MRTIMHAETIELSIGSGNGDQWPYLLTLPKDIDGRESSIRCQNPTQRAFVHALLAQASAQQIAQAVDAAKAVAAPETEAPAATDGGAE